MSETTTEQNMKSPESDLRARSVSNGMNPEELIASVESAEEMMRREYRIRILAISYQNDTINGII